MKDESYLKKLINTKCRIFLKNRFKYYGLVKAVDENFLQLADEKTGLKITISLSDLSTIEEVGK